MKEITKEKVSTYTVYKAIDGTEFRDREECVKYEQTAKAVLKTKFLKLVVKESTEYGFFGVGNDDNIAYAVRPNSQEDVDTIFQLYLIDRSYLLEDKDDFKIRREETFNLIESAFKEHDILFINESYEGDIWIINSRERLISSLLKIGKTEEEEG